MYSVTGSNQPKRYQITVAGVLEHDWQDWFDGMSISIERDTSVLTGVIADQPALYGLINKLRDLGLSLLSVTRLDDC